MTQLPGSSVTYRIALGLRAGRQTLVLRTTTPLAGEDTRNERVANAHGFSLHAGDGVSGACARCMDREQGIWRSAIGRGRCCAEVGRGGISACRRVLWP